MTVARGFTRISNGTTIAIATGTMKLQRTLLLPLSFTIATACLDVDALSPDEMLAETDSELSTANWSLTNSAANSLYGAQVATIGGVTYMVHTGLTDKNMYWRKRVGALTWSDPVLIPNQKTSDQVSLAAFNGFLYMLHVGESDTRAVWFSRFDPLTETWTPNTKLTSLETDTGAPALAAFDGRLWIVGAIETGWSNNQLWVSTMSPGEVFSGPVSLTRKLTTTRVSLAVFANKLYMAYGQGTSVTTMTHAVGAALNLWSAPRQVKAGPSNTTSQGWDPKLAVAGGYLHLVHTRPYYYGTATYWTYFDQCNWAPEVQFDGIGTDHAPSLTDGAAGLVLTREGYWVIDGLDTPSYHVLVTEYAAPPPPITVPQCGYL